MQAIEQAMVKLDQPGASLEVRSNIRKLPQDLKLIGLKLAHAGDQKTSLLNVTQETELGDEPVTKTLSAASAESSANVVWNEYKAEYLPPPENILYITSQRRKVGSFIWLSDEIVEVGSIDVASRYIASPLKPVSIEERDDEVLLLGQYLVLIIMEEGSNMEIMQNWLKITDMEKHKVTRRGINRKKEGALVTTAVR